MPRFRSIGLMPAATALRPSWMNAWASTVAVVVPSPATSEVLEAASLTICAPRFSSLSASSISLATETPSLVIVGEPKLFSSTTLRPFGPRVVLTALARVFTPRSRRARASSPKRMSLADMVVTPECECGDEGKRDGAGRNGVGALCAFHESPIPNPQSRAVVGSADHSKQIVFAHDQVFGAVNLDLGTRVLAEQHGVANLDLELAHAAVVQWLAFANGDDFATDRLLGGAVGDHDAASGPSSARAWSTSTGRCSRTCRAGPPRRAPSPSCRRRRGRPAPASTPWPWSSRGCRPASGTGRRWAATSTSRRTPCSRPTCSGRRATA